MIRTDQRYYSDISCRIAAFTLLHEDIISGIKVGDDTFLVGDIDALEQYDLCNMSKEQQGTYFSLLNPVSVPATTDSQVVLDALLTEWKTRGISFDNRKTKLICVIIFNSELDNIAYVGHAGVLVPDVNEWMLKYLQPTPIRLPSLRQESKYRNI